MAWLYIVVGVFMAWGILGLSILLFHKACLSWVYRHIFQRASVGILERLTVDMFDSRMKSVDGTEERYGSGSPWDALFLNPVYLHRMPLENAADVQTDIIIGPQARRPLRLRIPLLIAGMGYGTALSSLTKQALAMAATKAGTAANSGAGPILQEERAAAERLILQYSRGQWSLDEDALQKADAIEIQMGQGAWGPLPLQIPPEALVGDAKARRLLGLRLGEGVKVKSRVKGVNQGGDLESVVTELRQRVSGVPIGVKFGATHCIELELDLALKAGVDFVAIDGAEGGSSRNIDGLHLRLGIPTLYALVRARRFLDNAGAGQCVSLLVGGGLKNPDDFLKALALGADAVFIGRPALAALIKAQHMALAPWESPWMLLEPNALGKRRLNPHLAAEGLEEYLRQCLSVMKKTTMVLGKKHIREVNTDDLCTTDRELANWLGMGWVGEMPRYSTEEHITIPLRRMTVEFPRIGHGIL